MYRILLFALLSTLTFVACQEVKTPASSKAKPKNIRFSGPTMGTQYHITCGPYSDKSLQKEIDQLLVDLNQELSTYIPTSTISLFNQQNKSIDLSKHKYFKDNLEQCEKIVQASNGYFDPTVMPLVNYWGFGYKEKRAVEKVDSAKVDSLRSLVGFDKITWKEEGILEKTVANLQLDFSALAKGYAVDEVARLLDRKGIPNYLIEIGGELVTKGVNHGGNTWLVGINVPKKGAKVDELKMAIRLDNKGMATSGNYRIFYEGDGFDYAHTMNPLTGFPEKSDILSATVIAENCMIADGYATAFMAMGLESSMELVSKTEGLEAIFLYKNEKGELVEKATPAIQKLIKR